MRQSRRAKLAAELEIRTGTAEELAELRALQSDSIAALWHNLSYPKDKWAEKAAYAVDYYPQHPHRPVPKADAPQWLCTIERIRELANEPATLNDAVLDKILNDVGSNYVPPALCKPKQRKKLRAAIKAALLRYAFYIEMVTAFEARRRRSASLKTIADLTKRLGQVWADENLWCEIASRLQLDNGDPRAIVAQVNDVVTKLRKQAFPEVDYPSSPLERLSGWDLPQIFEDFFKRDKSRGGPCLRFVSAVMSAFSISYKQGSISRAIGYFSASASVPKATRKMIRQSRNVRK